MLGAHVKTPRTVSLPRRSFCRCRGRLLLGWRQVRGAAVRHFCRQADALAKRRVRVDGLANVHGVWTHLALHCTTGISPMDSKQDSTLVYQAAMVAVLPKALV